MKIKKWISLVLLVFFIFCISNIALATTTQEICQGTSILPGHEEYIKKYLIVDETNLVGHIKETWCEKCSVLVSKETKTHTLRRNFLSANSSKHEMQYLCDACVLSIKHKGEHTLEKGDIFCTICGYNVIKCEGENILPGHENRIKEYMTVSESSKISLDSHRRNIWCDECFWMPLSMTEKHKLRKSIISVDDKKHTVEYICDICNLKCTETDEHVIKNDVCTICDYEEPICQGTNILPGHEKYIKIYMRVSNSAKVDLKSHLRDVWCDECFRCPLEITENHAIRKNIISVNDKKHTVEYICDICNLKCTETDEHVMENNVCAVCNYEKPKEKKIISVRADMDWNIKNYTGKEQEIKIENFDSEIMTISGNKAIERGKYKAIVSVKDPENYALSYNGIIGDTAEIDWQIVVTSLSLPMTSQKEYEYTGKEIQLGLRYVDELCMNVSGNKATEVGEYEAIISLKDTQNFEWANGSKESIKLKWKIVNSNSNENDSQNSSVEDSSEDETIIEEVKTYTTTIIQSKGGEIKTNNIEVEEGKNQTFRIIPDEGYKIVDVKVDGKSVGAVSKYILKNVKKTHKITAVFEEIVQEEPEDTENEESENQFEDVKSEEWYYESVKYATTKGLFKGVSDNEFAPNVTMNRAMLVTVLYRLDGEKETKYKNKFNDLENGAYYEDAVNWATKNKIVSGVSENEFAPSNKITREQLVVMLYRFAKLEGMNVNKEADLTSYEDYNEISEYAKEATAWAVKSGYINGRSETILAPKGTATRAEVATILMRFSEN